MPPPAATLAGLATAGTAPPRVERPSVRFRGNQGLRLLDCDGAGGREPCLHFALTPEELDRELPTQVREFVAGHVALGANLAEIQREREEAEKAAREELKKKQKTVGNGG